MLFYDPSNTRFNTTTRQLKKHDTWISGETEAGHTHVDTKAGKGNDAPQQALDGGCWTRRTHPPVILSLPVGRRLGTTTLSPPHPPRHHASP